MGGLLIGRPVTDDALRNGLAEAVAAHLPAQAGRLTPHLLRHYAASELYRNGMDVFVVQEVLGHEWSDTIMIYVNSRVLHQPGEKPQVTRSRRCRNSVQGLRKPALWPGTSPERSLLMQDPPVRRSRRSTPLFKRIEADRLRPHLSSLVEGGQVLDPEVTPRIAVPVP